MGVAVTFKEINKEVPQSIPGYLFNLNVLVTHHALKCDGCLIMISLF